MPKFIAYDTETHLIKPGCTTPKMVCLTWYDGENDGILLRDEGLAWLREKLLDPDVHLIGQNVFYDLGVPCAEDPSFLPLVFDAIDAGRIHDTILRQKVIDNFHGQLKYVWNEEKKKFDGQRFDLASLVWRHFKVNLFAKKDGEKNPDIWRLRYNELDGVPLEEWPKDAIDYAIDDSVWAYRIFMEQEKELAPEGMPSQVNLVGSAWALDLAASWGFRTDRERTLQLEAELLEELATWRQVAQECGRFVRKGVKQSKNLNKIREEVAKRVERPHLTKKGQIATTREQLREVPCPVCGEDFDAHNKDGFQPCETDDIKVIGLWATSEVTRVEKKLSTYVKVLKQGFDVPINCRYNPIIETFRTSSSGPNVQNWPRSGIRHCIVPRDGWVYAFCDLDTVEMGTLAQVCIDLFGYSKLADAINEGKDLHLYFASKLLQISYEECVARFKAKDPEIHGSDGARQFSKIALYGYSGGMGVDAFIDYAKTAYGMIVDRSLAERLHGEYREHFEMHDYFEHCSNLVGQEGYCKFMVFPRSGLVRGRVRYTAVCNSPFQHLAAMMAKGALYQTTKECYDPRLESPLYGCRPVVFMHDEIIMEIPEEALGKEATSAAALRLQEIMVESAREWAPDINIGATVAMARSWLKGVDPVFDGEYLVPAKKTGKEWVPDLEAAA
jgi:hypothetical protein